MPAVGGPAATPRRAPSSRRPNPARRAPSSRRPTPTRRPTSNRWLASLRTPLGLTAAALAVIVLVTAIVAPQLWSERADLADTQALLEGPSAAHPLGTDAAGRDLLARVLVATRLSVLLALGSTGIAVAAGLILGTAPILLGRRAGRAVTWFVGIAVAFPGFLLALFFAVIFGAGATGAALAIGCAGAPSFARLCQTLTQGVMGRDFVAAARVGGVGKVRILTRHVLPNIAEPLIVNATMGAGNVLLSFAGLSFLGLGVTAPAYDWGRLMNEGLSGIYMRPIAALAPGAAVVLAGMAFNLVGETVARVLGLAAGTTAPPRGWFDRVPPPPRAASPVDDDVILRVRDLTVSFPTPTGVISPVRGVGFDIPAGGAVGLVGESGSGKSLTALAVSHLIEPPGRVEVAKLVFAGADIAGDGARAHRHLLGQSLAVVFQDPMTSLNPTMRVGEQLAEVSREHGGLTRRAAWARAVDRLAAVRIQNPARRARAYPHEFSGGMRQRAMIGMGVMGSPRLIVADEPTTALDVTVQQQVLDLLAQIRAAEGASLLMISHDVSVVASVCDRIMVMYAGRIVEELPSARLHSGAAHPYTRALVAAVPDMWTDVAAPLPTIPGRPAEAGALPPGCAFAPRCPLAGERCRTEEPDLAPTPDGRVACWYPGAEATAPAAPAPAAPAPAAPAPAAPAPDAPEAAT